MVEAMEIFIKYLETTRYSAKGHTNISNDLINAAEQQKMYMEKGYCSPPPHWGMEKLFYAIGKRTQKLRLQRYGKVFGTSGIENINRPLTLSVKGIGNMLDETAHNRITVNLYQQEHERRKLLGNYVPPDAYKFTFLHEDDNAIHNCLYGKDLFKTPQVKKGSSLKIRFGYHYARKSYQDELMKLLAEQEVRAKEIMKISKQTLKLGGVKRSPNASSSRKYSSSSSNNNNLKKRRVKTILNTQIGSHASVTLTKDEALLVAEAVAYSQTMLAEGKITNNQVAMEAYKYSLQKYHENGVHGGMTSRKLQLRAPLHINIFTRYLEKPLKGQVNVDNSKKDWPIDVNDINNLSRREASEYVDFLKKKGDIPATKIVYSRGTKRKKAAIDAILEARNNLNE